MAYEQKEGDIAIFQNTKKTKETQPDYTGTALINGEVMKVALWEKSPTMMAGKIQIDTYKQSPHDQAKQNGFQKQNDEMEDEIPF